MSYEITIEGGSSKKLLTAGKYCDRDIVVTATGGGGGTGGGAEWNDVTFIDYDGTVLYSYSTAEAKALTEMPPLPTQPGLICQGWNYDLETVKSYDTPVTVGATYITDDGKTRIYISLEEGRTSPMLGCCPAGTVTVDWGDGTAPDVLTGTSTSTVVWTPTHNYAAPGDYVISLTVNGEVVLLGGEPNNHASYVLHHSSVADGINIGYMSAVRKIEIGNNVGIGSYSFSYCRLLRSITIPNSVTSVGSNAFYYCYSLRSITIPNSVTSVGSNVFNECSSLSSVAISNNVKSVVTGAFSYCRLLRSITIPNSVTSVGNSAFNACYSLRSITIPNSVTSIGTSAMSSCYSLSGVVLPNSVTSVGKSAFSSCYSLRFIDFTSHTSVPTLSNSNVLNNSAADCEIRVPAALYDEWIAATNWSSLASKIVAV